MLKSHNSIVPVTTENGKNQVNAAVKLDGGQFFGWCGQRLLCSKDEFIIIPHIAQVNKWIAKLYSICLPSFSIDPKKWSDLWLKTLITIPTMSFVILWAPEKCRDTIALWIWTQNISREKSLCAHFCSSFKHSSFTISSISHKTARIANSFLRRQHCEMMLMTLPFLVRHKPKPLPLSPHSANRSHVYGTFWETLFNRSPAQPCREGLGMKKSHHQEDGLTRLRMNTGLFCWRRPPTPPQFWGSLCVAGLLRE